MQTQRLLQAGGRAAGRQAIGGQAFRVRKRDPVPPFHCTRLLGASQGEWQMEQLQPPLLHAAGGLPLPKSLLNCTRQAAGSSAEADQASMSRSRWRKAGCTVGTMQGVRRQVDGARASAGLKPWHPQSQGECCVTQQAGRERSR